MYAMKLLHQHKVKVFVYHEASIMARIHRDPCIIVCVGDGFGIYTGTEVQWQPYITTHIKKSGTVTSVAKVLSNG